MRGKILVVEDASHIRELFQEILADEGFEVEAIARPFANISEIIGLQPNVIILDYLFNAQPHGERMLQQLALCPTTAHIPVILCTASTKAIEKEEAALMARGGRVLEKPFEIDDLLLSIQQVLADRELPHAVLWEPEIGADRERVLVQYSLVRSELRHVPAS